jgi:hypothetical protein
MNRRNRRAGIVCFIYRNEFYRVLQTRLTAAQRRQR